MTLRIAWVQQEIAAQRRLRADLRAFLGLARMAQSFADRALRVRAASPSNDATLVEARLLAAASNQLRIVELAAQRGYSLQALGAVATLYEHVSALGYVHGDNGKARQWVSHTDFASTYPPPKKRATGVRFMLAATGVPPNQVEPLVNSWEDHYTRFCAAKHGNPALLSKYGVTRTDAKLTLHLGPIGGPVYTLLSRMALYHGSRLLADAAVLFATPILNDRRPDAAVLRRARARTLARISALASVRTLQRPSPNGAA